MTLGTPIGMFVKNKDMRPHDYGDMSQVTPRFCGNFDRERWHMQAVPLVLKSVVLKWLNSATRDERA